MQQDFTIEVRQRAEAEIWTTQYHEPDIRVVCAQIPTHGFYRCTVKTYARMIRKSRQELLDRIADVNDGYEDFINGQYADWPKPLLAVMCGEWEAED